MKHGNRASKLYRVKSLNMHKTKIKKIDEIIDHLGQADLHIHSNFSDAKPSIEEILEYVEKKTDLNVIAITDHDTIEGALKAQKIVKEKDYRFEVIVGEEISTLEGHVLGLFLKKVIKSGLSVEETLRLIKEQNGVTIAPHPFYHTRMNNGKTILMDGIGLITLLKEKDKFDGIEVLNATPVLRKDNVRAGFINNALLVISETGSSDAHILDAIGKGYTLFEGRTTQDLREALKNGQTRAGSRDWNFMALFRYLFFFIPSGFRIALFSIVHGRRKKRPQIINCPRKYTE